MGAEWPLASVNFTRKLRWRAVTRSGVVLPESRTRSGHLGKRNAEAEKKMQQFNKSNNRKNRRRRRCDQKENRRRLPSFSLRFPVVVVVVVVVVCFLSKMWKKNGLMNSRRRH